MEAIVIVSSLFLIFLMANSTNSYPLDSPLHPEYLERIKLVKEPKRYCGHHLREKLSDICESYPSISHESTKSKSITNRPNISKECCVNPCSLEHLATYCATTRKPLVEYVDYTTPRTYTWNSQHSEKPLLPNEIRKDHSSSMDESASNILKQKFLQFSTSSYRPPVFGIVDYDENRAIFPKSVLSSKHFHSSKIVPK